MLLGKMLKRKIYKVTTLTFCFFGGIIYSYFGKALISHIFVSHHTIDDLQKYVIFSFNRINKKI